MGGGNCNPKDFGAAAYWDARYSSPSTVGKDAGGSGFCDWYQSYSALRPLLRACVPTSSRALMLGCGNSLLSEDMVMDGYQNIVNIDISSVVIEQMKEKHMDGLANYADEEEECGTTRGHANGRPREEEEEEEEEDDEEGSGEAAQAGRAAPGLPLPRHRQPTGILSLVAMEWAKIVGDAVVSY